MARRSADDAARAQDKARREQASDPGPMPPAGAKRPRRASTPEAQVNGDIDNYFAGAIEAARIYTGRTDIQPASSTEDLIIGLRMPALSCAILFNCDVMPLSRVVRITGKRGCNKSALLYEFERWVIVHNGFVAHVETEGKDTPDLRSSVLQHRKDWLTHNFRWHPADSQQDWQKAVQFWVRHVGKQQDITTGWRRPLIVGVDSFTAAAAEEEHKKIEKVGHAERGYASEALLNARYLPSLPPLVRNKPILIAGISHGISGTDAMGRPEFRAKGGQAMSFFETFEVRATKIKGNKTAEGGWNFIELRTDKNSLGADAVKLKVRFEWMFEPDPDDLTSIRQVSNWDWHAATIEAFADMKKDQKGMWNDVNQIVDLHLTDSGRRGWSKALDIPNTKTVSWTELGKALDKRRDIVDALYVPLKIRRRTPFIPGVPFSEQIAKGKAAMRELEGDSLYEEMDTSRFEVFDRELEEAVGGRKSVAVDPDEYEDEDDE